MKDRQEEHQYTPEADTLAFPDHTVVAIIDEPDDAAAALDALITAGVPEENISLLYGEGGAERLDPAGKRHGALGRLRRLIQHYGDEDRPHVRRQAEELRAGNFLVAAPATEEERDRVAGILKAHGGHFINHYTPWTVTALEE